MKNIPTSNRSNRILNNVPHMWLQKWGAMQLGFWLNSKLHSTTHVIAKWNEVRLWFYLNRTAKYNAKNGLKLHHIALQTPLGNIIVAPSQKIQLPYSMDLAEALACSRIVTFAQELSLFQVVFEGDSLRIVQAINNQGANLTLFGHVRHWGNSLTLF